MKTQQMRWWLAGVVVFVLTAALWWHLAEARREREAIEQARRRLAAMEEARRHHAEAAEVLRRLEALSTNLVVRTNLVDWVLHRLGANATVAVVNPVPFVDSLPRMELIPRDLLRARTNLYPSPILPAPQIDTPPWPKTNHTAKSIFAGNDRM